MLITDQSSCERANLHFNHFHDGLFKSISIVSGNKMLADFPWEPKRKFSTNEEALEAMGLAYFSKRGAFLKIAHYNYDWPNQPPRRMIKISAPNCDEIHRELSTFTGTDIFDLSFFEESSKISCRLSYHSQTYATCSMDNADQVILFSASSVRIIEGIGV